MCNFNLEAPLPTANHLPSTLSLIYGHAYGHCFISMKQKYSAQCGYRRDYLIVAARSPCYLPMGFGSDTFTDLSVGFVLRGVVHILAVLRFGVLWIPWSSCHPCPSVIPPPTYRAFPPPNYIPVRLTMRCTRVSFAICFYW
jgi:hypothetical protein